MKKSRYSRCDRGDARSRFSRDGVHMPARPADAELHRRIGPTQNYGDDT